MMATFLCRGRPKQIISNRCLTTLRETLKVLMDYVEWEELFISSGNLGRRKRIQSCFSRGDLYTLRNWGFEFPVECAAALKLFLQNLPEPLIPMRIQNLVTADNVGVDGAVVACDALGLLSDEVTGNHRELLIALLTFLLDASLATRTTELSGYSLPLKLLPVFFHLKDYEPDSIRRIAIVFYEMILHAQKILKRESSYNHQEQVLQAMSHDDLIVPTFDFSGLLSRGENDLPPFPQVPQGRLHPMLGHFQ